MGLKMRFPNKKKITGMQKKMRFPNNKKIIRLKIKTKLLKKIGFINKARGKMKRTKSIGSDQSATVQFSLVSVA